MPTYTACLVDVFDTVLSVDFAKHTIAFAESAGVDPADFAIAAGGWSHRVMDGTARFSAALMHVLRDCGMDADEHRVRELVEQDGRLLHEFTTLHNDAVPFLGSLRARGIRTALVSNCADNARALLATLGLDKLVDDVVLSCEVRAAKPDPSIYRTALERLQVEPHQALFVDDQQAYCDGASALGIHAVRLDRFNGSGEVTELTSLLRHFQPTSSRRIARRCCV